jgi:hypothetical protein
MSTKDFRMRKNINIDVHERTVHIHIQKKFIFCFLIILLTNIKINAIIYLKNVKVISEHFINVNEFNF